MEVPGTIVGVDGGTSKTIALVAGLDGKICAAARGGGSNWTGEDVHIPMTVVVQVVQRAWQAAGVPAAQAALGMFTLAGADWPEDHIRRQAFLAGAGLARQIVVKNDSFGGLRAGLSRPYGLVIAAGTGCNAAVITPDRQEWAFGYYETYGGAGSLAEDAFVAVLRAEDGRGQPTALTGLVLAELGFPTTEAMLRAHIQQSIPRHRYLDLCPLVFQAACHCDDVAADLLVRQGLGLAEYATAMIRRFNLQTLEFEVVLAGSVFKGQGSLLIDTINQAVHRVAPRALVRRSTFEPVVGSLLLAYDALSIPTDAALMANLVATLPGAAFFDTARLTAAPDEIIVWQPDAALPGKVRE